MKSSQIFQHDSEEYKKNCKKLLSHKIILAVIIKQCIKEFSDADINYICDSCIEGSPEISEIPPADDNNRPNKNEPVYEAFYDLRFYAYIPYTSELVKFIINIDIPEKKKRHSSRVKKGIYYSSKLLSMQDEVSFTAANCRDAHRVCSLWICPDDSGRTSDAVLHYRFSEEVSSGFAPETFSPDVIEVVTIYLDTGNQEKRDGVTGFLKTLLSETVPVHEKMETLRNFYGIVPDQVFEKDFFGLQKR